MTVVNPALRERLSEVQTELRAARADLSRLEANARKPDSSDQEIMAATRAAVTVRTLSERERALVQEMGDATAGRRFSGGESFIDEAMARELEQLAYSNRPIGPNMSLGQLCSAAEVVDRIRSGDWSGQGRMYAADSSGGVVDTTVGGGAARLGPWRGILPQLRRRLRILDLIQTQTMDAGSSFKYTQELGSFDTAVETAELAAKSPADVDYEDAEVVAQTVAHWFKVSRQSLADVPQLLANLNSRLMYGVFRRVENQILAGDGTGQNLRGILNTTGIASVAFTAGDVLTDQALTGITDVLVSDADPNGVVANPVDVQTMLTAKAAGSGERLDSNGAFATLPDTLWGLPLIVTRVMPQGTLLVGDWSQGATLWVREGVNIRSSDSDQDDFTKNRITLLGEGRFGLSVERPVCFAEVALA